MPEPELPPEPNTLTPEQFVAKVRSALPLSTPEHGRELRTIANAWAICTYGPDVPEALAREIKELGDIPTHGANC